MRVWASICLLLGAEAVAGCTAEEGGPGSVAELGWDGAVSGQRADGGSSDEDGSSNRGDVERDSSVGRMDLAPADASIGTALDAPGVRADVAAEGGAAVIVDVHKSLIANAEFPAATGTTGWKAEFTLVKVEWDSQNAGMDAQSGSLAVTNMNMAERDGYTEMGAAHCLDAPSGAYWVGADVFIPAGQGSGMGGLRIGYFSSHDCQGGPITVPVGLLAGGVGMWVRLQASSTPPPGANSMLVRALGFKPFRQPSLKVLFDNVLVQAK